MTSTMLPPSALPDVQVFGDPHLHIDGELLALAFAPDGTLWSVEEPGVLRHWDPASGRQLEWQSLSDLETQWCFSADARVLASASNDLSFWDTSSGQVLTAVSQPSWVTALAFHPDPAFLATGHDDGIVRLWDAAGHYLVREFRFHKQPISALAFSPSGTRLASAAEDKKIAVWNADDGQQLGVLVGHSDRIPALAWHPGEQFLVSAGWDTTARVWDTRTQQPVILLNTHAAQVTALAFSRDGSLLACGDSAPSVRLWSFADRKELHVLKGTDAEIRCLAFSPDGKRLAGNGDRIIHIWDVRSGQAQAGSGARTAAHSSLALSPGGSRLATNGGGLAARVWDVASRKVLLQLQEEAVVHDLTWSPDARWLAGAAGKHVRLWEAASGKPGLALEGSDDPFTCLAFAADSATLATASASGLAVWIWRVADGEPILLIPDALDGCTVEALAFHPEGRLLAVGGIDWLATGGSSGAVSLWDLVERCEVATFLGGTTCIAFHPSGLRLASSSLEQSICIWDVQAKEIVAELTGPESTVMCLAYSPDGSLLASGGADRTLRLWDEAGQELGLLELDSQIQGLAFSPDGRFLYTANANTTCYQLEVKRLLADAE
jgi:WD40 repeat protein